MDSPSRSGSAEGLQQDRLAGRCRLRQLRVRNKDHQVLAFLEDPRPEDCTAEHYCCRHFDHQHRYHCWSHSRSDLLEGSNCSGCRSVPFPGRSKSPGSWSGSPGSHHSREPDFRTSAPHTRDTSSSDSTLLMSAQLATLCPVRSFAVIPKCSVACHVLAIGAAVGSIRGAIRLAESASRPFRAGFLVNGATLSRAISAETAGFELACTSYKMRKSSGDHRWTFGVLIASNGGDCT